MAQTSLGQEFIVAPYLLAPNMAGNVTVGNHPAEVDVGPGEIFENLDAGAMLSLGARFQDWAVSLDGLYMNLGAEGKTPVTGRQAKVDMKQLAVDGRVYKRVAPWAEIGIGGRLNSIEGGLFVPAGATMALQEIDVSGSQTWFDPLIAARLTVPTENHWRLGVVGDIGGFGVGSDFAWQVLPFVGYRFSKLFELAAAFRALGMKYENGSGPRLFIYDMVIFGPEVGLLFHL
jgi:hypothetical protein